jgi:hypothetical protein
MTRDLAVVAVDSLNLRFPGARPIAIAPLGTASDPGGPTTVIAGRFATDVIEAVREAVADLGGTVVVDANEESIKRR